MRYLYRPLLAGLTGFAGARILYPRGGKVPIWGSTMGIGTSIAISTAASAFVTDMLHERLFPAIHVSEKLGNQVSSLTNLGLSAGSTIAVAYFQNPDFLQTVGVGKLAALGVASEVVSSYLYNNYW